MNQTTEQLIERTKETGLYMIVENKLNNKKINNIIRKHGINRLYKTRWFLNLIDNDMREHQYNRGEYVVIMDYILNLKKNE